jgi:hypothetical protein
MNEDSLQVIQIKLDDLQADVKEVKLEVKQLSKVVDQVENTVNLLLAGKLKTNGSGKNENSKIISGLLEILKLLMVSFIGVMAGKGVKW